MKKEYERFTASNIFEGIVSLRALIANAEKQLTNPSFHNRRKILTVYYDKDRFEREKKEYAWLTHRAEALGFPLEICDRHVIDEMTVGNTHGGIAVLTDHRPLLALSEAALSNNGFHVALEGIEDPYNFGYALRSLYAAGVDGIWLPERNWMSAAGVVCRASAGASELLPMYSFGGEDAVTRFKKEGYRIVCADLRNSVSLYNADLKTPLLLIVGGEKRGISSRLLALSDLNVRIDYARDFEASLSAASAATVVGFEIYRQNHSVTR